MRLIDADALTDRLDALAYDDWNQGVSTTWADAFKAFAEMVRDERTVEPCREAIPIEWIEEWGWKNGMSESMSLRVMIDDWEKENETV